MSVVHSNSARFEQDELTRSIIESVIRVHQSLGPGFIERIYHQALLVEFARRNLPFATEYETEVFYEGNRVGIHRLDLVVDRRVIVELKAIEELTKIHYAQVRSYLKATGLQVGLLINFAKEKADYRRIELKK